VKRKNLFFDTIFFTAFAVFGAILWFMIPVLLPGNPGFQIDTRLFPRVIAVLLFLVGLASAVTSWVCMKKSKQELEPPGEDENSGQTQGLRVIGMALIMFLYAFLTSHLGFLLASFVAVTAILILQKIRKIHCYIAVYAAGYIIYCIFHYILMVQLP
jgi:hypothetical protein